MPPTDLSRSRSAKHSAQQKASPCPNDSRPWWYRAVRHRLVVDLVETSRENGKVKSEHIARLGSVALPEPIGVRERVRFWRELKERFRDIASRLANRVGPDDRRKALAAIHARIAKPTEADEQAARIEMARADVAFWERFRDESSADSMSNQTRRRMMATLERQLADEDGLKAIAEQHITDAQQRFLALTRGERVAGDGDAQERKAAVALRAAQLRAMMGTRRLLP